MSAPLQSLYRQLRWLRWHRWTVRVARSACIGSCAALLAAALVFAIDWSLDLEPGARLIVMAVAVALGGFASIRFLRTRAWQLENDVQLALLVERRERLENDLVGALQFNAPAAKRWGSLQLESAVIEYVDDFAEHLDFDREREPRMTFVAPALGAIMVAGITVAAWIAWPDYGGAFLDRLALRTIPYPTQTEITALFVNQQSIAPDAAGVESRVAFGQAVRFEVHADGEPPDAGFIELATSGESRRATIDLVPSGEHFEVWSAEIPKLVEDLEYQVYLGDAHTTRQSIVVIPLPVVNVALTVKPPDYTTSDSSQPGDSAGTRQISVLEGSDVSIHVATKSKPLGAADLKIGDHSFALTADDATRLRWTLAPQGTPLAAMRDSVAYEIIVTDDDGLHTAEPIRGSIAVRIDRPPRVTAAIVTEHVLPTGRPSVTYGAVDDFGVTALRVRRQVLHNDGSIAEDVVDLPRETPVRAIVQGRCALDLASLNLAKGDQVKVTVEASDFRGRRPGKRASSDPLVFHVTDERGVLAAMAETDQRTARQMDDIIERQLGIGAVELP